MNLGKVDIFLLGCLVGVLAFYGMFALMGGAV